MFVALIFFAALLGPALVAVVWRGNTGPALAAAALVLPGLMLTDQHDTAFDPTPDDPSSVPVPRICFALVGLAPAALLPLLLAGPDRLGGWKHWLPGLVLVLIPVGLAVYLTADAVTIDWDALFQH
jgi:hypothetical protein